MTRQFHAALFSLLLLLATPVFATPDKDLIAAVEAIDSDAAKAALSGGADANARNDKGAPVLFIAVQKRSADLAELLVEAGANPDAQYEDYIGATPLMMAVGVKDLQLAKLLLENDADVNVIDANGDPAINWAAYYGYTDFVELFVRHKADTKLTGHGNALEIAMRRGHQDIVSLLTDRKATAIPNPDIALMVEAIQTGDAKGVAEALGFGVSPDSLDFTGRPILALAARKGAADIVRRLIQAGATVDLADQIGFTPLFEAAREGNAAAAKLLLEAGANPDHRSNATALALTPMHMAALSNSAETVKLLAAHGANLNVTGRDNGTPLLWALGERKITSSLALLELGADATIESRHGFSATDLAKSIENAEIRTKLGLSENEE